MSFKSMYFHSLDVKNRLFIPAKFREELGEKFIADIKAIPYPDKPGKRKSKGIIME